MSGHAAGNGVDGELDFNAVFVMEVGGHFLNNVLRLSDGHAVTGNDDNFVGVFHDESGVFGISGLSDFYDAVILCLSAGGFGTETSEHNAGQRAVHCLYHNIRQNCAAGTHNRTDDNQQNVIEREADADSRPSGISIQYGNDNRHVGAANRQNKQKTEDDCQGCQNIEKLMIAAQGKHNANRNDAQSQKQVQQLLSGENNRTGRHQPLQFGKGNNRPGKSDGADEQAERGFKIGVCTGHDLGDGDENRGQTAQAVKRGNHLRQCGHFDFQSAPGSDYSAETDDEQHPFVIGNQWRIHGDRNGESHAEHSQQIAAAGRFGRSQSAD